MHLGQFSTWSAYTGQGTGRHCKKNQTKLKQTNKHKNKAKKQKGITEMKDKAGLSKNKLSRIKPGHGFSLMIYPPHPITSLSGKAEGLGWGYSYITVLLQGTDHKVKTWVGRCVHTLTSIIRSKQATTQQSLCSEPLPPRAACQAQLTICPWREFAWLGKAM